MLNARRLQEAAHKVERLAEAFGIDELPEGDQIGVHFGNVCMIQEIRINGHVIANALAVGQAKGLALARWWWRLGSGSDSGLGCLVDCGGISAEWSGCRSGTIARLTQNLDDL